MPEVRDLIIIGGGAAGHFALAELLRIRPHSRVLMLEKTAQVLAKVKISGGGRCNVTHQCTDAHQLLQNYPRGNPWLSKCFTAFSAADTIRWFGKRGVKIVAEADGRMFPESNRSDSIVQVLREAAQLPGVDLRLQALVTAVRHEGRKFTVELKSGEQFSAHCLLLASGGSPGPGGMQYLSGLNLPLIAPVPSLFTFNVAQHPWGKLMGLSLEDALVSIPSAGFSFRGAVLVTHWGFSGPAVLKLSAAAAIVLHDCAYSFQFSLDFLPDISTKDLEAQLVEQIRQNPRKKPLNTRMFGIPVRLWEQLCEESGLAAYHNWAEAGKKSIQKMVQLLKNKTFQASGKTTFKEEFVTAGGVDLAEVSPQNCESLKHEGLFFAGELLNIDGFTGGFNFQAAWSTAHAAAKGIAARLNAPN